MTARKMFPSTSEGQPNPPWSSQRAAWNEIDALQAAAAYEHFLFSGWQTSRGMGGRNNHDAHQAATTRYLATGGVRICYDDFGKASRLRDLQNAGAGDRLLTVDDWLELHGEADASRVNITTLAADVETIALMRWAFAHEARMATINHVAHVVSAMRQRASADQVERMTACARGGVHQVAHYAMYAAGGSLRVLRRL
jgi:hypothetical protein